MKNKINNLIKDINSNKSYSLNYLLSNEVQETLSKRGIVIRKITAPLLRFIYGFQSDYKFVLDSREPLKYTKKGITIMLYLFLLVNI